MNKPKVSIIIVNYNGGKVFKECLESLKEIQYPNYELIIVDNDSSDGTEKLSNIRNKKNLGFAGGNNRGVKEAKGKYILLLNNDTKVTVSFLNVMVAKMEKEKEIGVLQPKIYLMDKPRYLDNAGSFLTRIGLLQHWGFMQKDSREFASERQIFSAKGACMLIRREVIEKIGLFDDDFISYFEESDFCWRVWLAGYKVLYYPRAVIYHKVGFTSKRMNQMSVTLISSRNRIASLFKNLSTINLFLILLPHILFLSALGFYYLFRLKHKSAWTCYGAIWENSLNFNTLLVKRRKTQKLRVKSDKDLFPIIMNKIDIGEMFSHFLKVEANLNAK
jgi:GT2 family glycosyltransferase